MFNKYIESGILLVVLATEPLAAAAWRSQSDRQSVEPVGAPSRRPKPRKTVSRYQSDPLRLVREFYLDKSGNRSAFNMAFAVEQALGQGAWSQLDEKQRAALTKAYDNRVTEILKEWDPQTLKQVRVLKSEYLGDQVSVMVLRDLEMIKFTLVMREGAWFIAEHEIFDDALPEFADTIRSVLQPGSGRGVAYEMADEAAQAYVDNLIATQGETAQLLLLKYRLLVSRQIEEEQARSADRLRAILTGKAETAGGQPRSQAIIPLQDDRGLEMLQQITTRWPDFAPGQLALAFDLLYCGNSEPILSSVTKDAERAIAPLQRYIKLIPYDPRPWRDLAHAYALLEKNPEAERAFHTAIERDPTYLDHHLSLVSFLLSIGQLEKAKSGFKEMLKIKPDLDDVFEGLYDENGFDPDYARALESMLISFPKELAASKPGMVLLASAQESQNKAAEAAKTMQSVVAVNAEADDYEYLSQLYRQQQRFPEALNAANQALKLDSKFAGGYFERACSLAQLGRKREALASLKQLMELDTEILFDLDDLDLQPLANLPEFKAVKEKMRGNSNSSGAATRQEPDQTWEKTKSGKP
jgi:tetratricopeptide (TPR) repeat protein